VLSRPWVLAAGAGLFAGLAAVVLYVILSGPVHAVGQPPEALSGLKVLKTPKPVPAVAFTDARGGRHSLSDFKGRYVLLNLWATWCAPCVRELPALASLKRQADPGTLEVVAVNVGRSTAAETQTFLKGHAASALAVYVDNNLALMRAFGAYGLPMTVLIDPEGREVAQAFGPQQWAAPGAVDYFNGLPKHAP